MDTPLNDNSRAVAPSTSKADDEVVGHPELGRTALMRRVWQGLGGWKGPRFGFVLAVCAALIFWLPLVSRHLPPLLVIGPAISAPLLGGWGFVVCLRARSTTPSWAWAGLWISFWGCLAWWLGVLILILFPGVGNAIEAFGSRIETLYRVMGEAASRGVDAVLVIAGVVGGAAIVALGLIPPRRHRPPDSQARCVVTEFLQFTARTVSVTLFCGLVVLLIPPSLAQLRGWFGTLAILAASVLCPLFWLIARAMPGLTDTTTGTSEDPYRTYLHETHL